jgi:hypothetical protein
MQRSFFLYDYQTQVLDLLAAELPVARGETFTVMFPRQAGKNQVSAMLVAYLLWGNAERGGSIVLCAPTQRPQAAISMARTRHALDFLRKIAGQSDAGLPRYNESGIELGNASAVFLSASPEAHVAGHTASLALIADEAQDIESDWFHRQFSPMAASTGACTVMFGTPWNGDSLLEQAVARNRRRQTYEKPRHFQVSWQEAAEVRPAYGDFVRAQKERLGATHPNYLSQYELVAGAAEGRLLTASQLELLRGTHRGLEAPEPGARYVAGLDFGGEGPGADATVLTIGRIAGERLEIVGHERWRSAPQEALLVELTSAANHWRLERICADATGMGAPLISMLRRALGDRIEGLVFTTSLKSQMAYDLIAAINTRRITIYADDGSREYRECLDELRSCRSEGRRRGELSWFAPPAKHDDYVASLVLCQRAGAMIGPERVAVGRRRE